VCGFFAGYFCIHIHANAHNTPNDYYTLHTKTQHTRNKAQKDWFQPSKKMIHLAGQEFVPGYFICSFLVRRLKPTVFICHMESPNDHCRWVCVSSWGFHVFFFSAQPVGCWFLIVT